MDIKTKRMSVCSVQGSTRPEIKRLVKKKIMRAKLQIEEAAKPSCDEKNNETQYAVGEFENAAKEGVKDAYIMSAYTAKRTSALMKARFSNTRENVSYTGAVRDNGDGDIKIYRYRGGAGIRSSASMKGSCVSTGIPQKEDSVRIYKKEDRIKTSAAAQSSNAADLRNRRRKIKKHLIKREETLKSAKRKKVETAVKLKRGKAAAAVLAAAVSAVILFFGAVFAFSQLMCSGSGILFSSEAAQENNLTVKDAIRAVNDEFQRRIEDEETAYSLSSSVVEGRRCTWRELMAVYAVKYSKENDDEVLTVTDEKIQAIKDIFWDMNSYDTSVEMRTEQGERPDELTEADDMTETLIVTVTSRDALQMAEYYAFTPAQIKELNFLLSDEVREMWNKVLYGIGLDSDIVDVASSQLGQIGGEPYWSWWGYSARVEWCAIFVSWCAEQCGYLDDETMPKFENCQWGAQLFKNSSSFEDALTEPDKGWIIFFDWQGDGISDHVGIVEKYEDGNVYTIEGNSGDMCRQKTYVLGSSLIYGYGVPQYDG